VADFAAGQKVVIDAASNMETAVIANVGTAGATTTTAALDAGGTVVTIGSPLGFAAGQAITIDAGPKAEKAVVATIAPGGRGGPSRLTLTAPVTSAHAAGSAVAGTGITLTTALTKAHDAGAQLADNQPTPGARNTYSRR
jgi:hypothetical protein